MCVRSSLLFPRRGKKRTFCPIFPRGIISEPYAERYKWNILILLHVLHTVSFNNIILLYGRTIQYYQISLECKLYLNAILIQYILRFQLSTVFIVENYLQPHHYHERPQFEQNQSQITRKQPTYINFKIVSNTHFQYRLFYCRISARGFSIGSKTTHRHFSYK